MPLVRYEVRCEHSLANPELFRSAARDDPEGLLEGVAMAGLVGIIRQLGDLAEFAAEVFRDLHNELVTVGGRTHDLTVRVQSLEAELPAVEKALLSEPNQLRFAYTNGADWHVSIRSDQNHCTSGELPRFIRNFYEECRGPPRLFLLDKFDAAGAGACLKRYTDPSFFKVEWASSELMKAQRAQRERKARREKKKGRRRKTGQPIAAVTQIPARVRYGSASLDDLDTFSHLLASTLKDEVPSSHSVPGASYGHGNQVQAHAQRRSNLGPKGKMAGGPLPPTGPLSPQAEGASSTPLKISAKDIEANVSGKFYHPIESGSVAESQGGKISKIIEMENLDILPSVGLIPRNGDIKSPKQTSDLKALAFDVEAKVTNRVGGKDLEVDATENELQGISRSDASTDGLQGSGFGRASKISTVDIPSRETAAVDDKERVNIVDLRRSSGSANSGTTFSGSQANSLISSEGPSIGGVDFVNAQVSSTSGGLSCAGSTADELGSLALGSEPVNSLDDQPSYSTIEPPAGVRASSTAAVEVEGLPASEDPAFHDDHSLRTKRVPINTVDSSEVSWGVEEKVNKQPYLPPIRIEEVSDDEGSRTISASSPTPSSQCSSPTEDLKPSTSMLSRISYSSELASVFNGSELASPASSKSPAFNTLYSPSRSPRFSEDGMKSPPGIYSRSGHRLGRGSSLSETPGLSLSPESPSASVWTDGGDHAGPSRPPPLPTPVTVLEAASHFDSDQETSLVEPRFHPPPSSHANLNSGSDPGSVPLQPNEGYSYISSLRENAGNLHAESSSSYPGNLEPKQNPYSSGGPRTPEPASAHMGTNVSFSTAPVTSHTSDLGEGTGLDEADPSSELHQGPASNPDFANFVRSSLMLPPRPSESPASSVHTSPLGTPKHRSQCIFVTNPSVKHVPSPLGNVASYDTHTLPVKDEESVPSSPTGSVIIKDTPSPPGSPASNYSESESETHEFQSHSRPKTPVSPRSVAHALEDIKDERGRSDTGVLQDPRLTSPQSRESISGSAQDAGLVESASETVDFCVHSPPEGRLHAPVTRTSPHHGIAHEASLQASPPIRMQVDSGMTSPFDGMDAADLRPNSTARLSPKSRDSSASNSPPDSPPLRKYLGGEDEDSAFQWAGRSQPVTPSKMVTRVSPASEASNSPPTSPPRFLDRANSLKWRGRSESASLNPDFSLPPNLVCRSEISSPSSSPPPQSDIESPKEWDEGSVFSDSTDSLEDTTMEVAGSKVYRLPDSPLPPDSPTMSEDDRSSGPPSKPELDEDDDITVYHEHEIVRATATQHSSDSSSSALLKESDEVLSAEPKGSDDGSQIRDAKMEPSTFGSSTPATLPVTLSRLDANQQPMRMNSTTQSHESPPSPLAPEQTINPVKDAMAAAAHHNWNMIKALTFQDPGHSKLLHSAERSMMQDQTTESFNLRRTESIEKKVPIIRPSANINVAAILEKANAIRQAYVGSDGEDDDEDDWSDS